MPAASSVTYTSAFSAGMLWGCKRGCAPLLMPTLRRLFLSRSTVGPLNDKFLWGHGSSGLFNDDTLHDVGEPMVDTGLLLKLSDELNTGGYRPLSAI